LHDQQGNAAKILYNLGVDQHKVRSAVEFLIGRGDHIVGNASTTTLTPRAQKTIALASDAAYTFKSDTIKPEHLLIGLVYEDEGIAAGVLESLGVSKSKIYEATTHVLENNKSDAGNSNHEDEQN
jgi:ATP-dependent Clp protease ATP-binding subunit ClpC